MMRLKVIILHGCNIVAGHHKREDQEKTQLDQILTSSIHFLLVIPSFQPLLIQPKTVNNSEQDRIHVRAVPRYSSLSHQCGGSQWLSASLYLQRHSFKSPAVINGIFEWQNYTSNSHLQEKYITSELHVVTFDSGISRAPVSSDHLEYYSWARRSDSHSLFNFPAVEQEYSSKWKCL